MHRSCLALAGALCLGLAARAAAAPVAYDLTPEMRDGGLVALDVTLAFDGDASGVTRLDLPREFAGQGELWRQIADLKAAGATVSPASDEAPSVRVLRHAPGARVVVRYRVLPHQTDDPKGQDGLPDKALIRPTWFAALGEAVFAQPHDGDRRPATFHLGQGPKGWVLASDLEGDRPKTVADVVGGVVVGGADTRIVERQAAGGRVRVAVRGGWSFTDAQLADLLTPVIETERQVWRDRDEPFFVPLIPLKPLTPGAGSLHAGIGRTGAFVLYATTDNSLASFKWELAHEHEHVWIARAIGDLRKDNEALDYWLSEGFSDYAAARALLRSGEWTLDEFVAELNEVLERHGASPERRRANADIPAAFWSQDDVRQLPYDRGRLAALVWDRAIRDRTGGRESLDGVLIAQRRLAERNARAGNIVPAAALFPIVYRDRGGPDLADDLARHIERGEQILLPADVFSACARIETKAGSKGETVQRVILTSGLTLARRAACARTLGGK